MKKNLFRKFYDGIVNVLLWPFFRAVAAVFSHGATHFIFCVIIGVITFLLLTKDQEKITPHNLDVFVGYLSNYKDKYKEMELSSETIDNVSIQVILNSDDIKSATKGNFSNGVTVSFDGKIVQHEVFIPEKAKTAFSAPTYSKLTFLDSVVVALDSDPAISKCEVNASINPILGHSDAFVDSVTGFVAKEKIFIAGNTDLNYHIVKYNTGKVASCIAPKKFSEGKTRHDVFFFSDDIGVKKMILIITIIYLSHLLNSQGICKSVSGFLTWLALIITALYIVKAKAFSIISFIQNLMLLVMAIFLISPQRRKSNCATIRVL